MKRALIMGGNRFFGRHLALWLLQNNCDVTLFNRGQVDDQLGNRVHRFLGDRNNRRDLQQISYMKSWDLVFDQICFDASQARTAAEFFIGEVGHYYMTSTQSVYDYGIQMPETVFDPQNYKFSSDANFNTHYGEAKRQAEAIFYQAAFPVTTIRIPLILGKDDYTGRLDWHIKKIKLGESFVAPNLNAEIIFLQSSEAGRLIGELALKQPQFVGPINLASPGVISLGKLFQLIKEATAGKINVTDSNADHSPYGIEKDWTMSLEKMESLNLKAQPLMQWLPQLIDQRCKALFH